ncbi:MAG: NB-ARC domain-containing protein [Caldilineaceae bacterium]
MPDPQKLIILTELREAAGLTLTQMARACGLTGRQSRLTAGAWERGDYAPDERKRRVRFIGYLWDDLRLRNDPACFEKVWQMLVEAWGWAPMQDPEWRTFTNQPRPSESHSAFTDYPAPFQAPAQILHFVGREAECETICTLLKSDGGPPRVALIGMGGMGKTTLATHVAHAVRRHFADGILWANVAVTNPLDVIQSWAQLYGHDFSGLPDLECRAAAMRGVLADKQVLLVLDDVADIAAVRPLLPGGACCRVLVTTRNHDLAAALNAHPVAPPELTAPAGVDLLVHVLGAERVYAELDAAQMICKIVDGLPLAVEIVAQRLKARPMQPLANIVVQLEDARRRLGLQIGDQAVRASFAVSWEGLAAELRRVFALLAVFAGRAFAVDAVAHMAELNALDAEELLYELKTLSLLNAESAGYFRQHSLIADFAGEKLVDAAQASGRMAAYYAAFAKAHQHDYARLEPEWTNLLATIEAAHDQANWGLVITLVDTLHQPWITRGRYGDIRRGCEWGQNAAMQLANNTRQVQNLLRWGAACIEQGAYAEAKAHLATALQRAYALEEGGFIADAQSLLARIATEQNQYEEARLALAASEAIWQELSEPLKLAEGYLGQAWLYTELGPNFAEAERLGQQALRIYEAAAAQEQCAQTLHLLAYVALEQERPAQALTYAERARRLCEECHCTGELAAVLYLLVIIHRTMKQYAAAQEFAQQSLKLLRRLGIRRIEGMLLRQMSLIFKEIEEYEQAFVLAEKSRVTFRDLADQLGEAYALRNIGDLLALQNKRAEAKQAWLKVNTMAASLQNSVLLASVQERLGREIRTG